MYTSEFSEMTGLLNSYPAGEFWSSDFNACQKNGALARFVVGPDEISIAPAMFGDHQELLPDPSGTRLHNYQLEGEHRIELHSCSPKSDVMVKRRFDFTRGFIEIVNDISIRREFAAPSLSVDPIRLGPGWNLLRVLSWDGRTDSPEWIEKPVSLKSNVPFLSAVFSSSEGHLLGIGAGDDLWRWCIALGNDGAGSSFSIRKEDGQWRLRRTILLFKEVSPIPRRDLRLSWFMSFSKPSRDAVETAGAAEFQAGRTDWPDHAKASWDGRLSKFPCLHADGTRRLLKNFIRGLAASRRGPAPAVVSGLDLSVCDCSSHLGRGDGKKRPHWGVLELNRFRKWADRQLAANGARTRFAAAEGALLSKIPSFNL